MDDFRFGLACFVLGVVTLAVLQCMFRVLEEKERPCDRCREPTTGSRSLCVHCERQLDLEDID